MRFPMPGSRTGAYRQADPSSGQEEDIVELQLVQSSLFKPNVVEAPSAQLMAGAGLAELQPEATAPEDRDAAALLPEGATAVRLQVQTVQLMGGMAPGFLGLGAPKGAYLVTSVVDGISADPITFQGKVYEGMRDGDVLPLGEERDAPLNVYLRENELPRILGVSIAVFRSNQNLRDAGELISDVTRDKGFSTLADLISKAASAAVPAYGLIWQAATEVIGIVGRVLKAAPDEQLGYYEARFTNRFDDLGMGRHPDKGQGATIPVGRIRVAYEIDVV